MSFFIFWFEVGVLCFPFHSEPLAEWNTINPAGAADGLEKATSGVRAEIGQRRPKAEEAVIRNMTVNEGLSAYFRFTGGFL